ncbi:MAG: dihydroxyacetone kinase subunit DhaL [Synergistota bacterium]|jgi:dihydroxyacetone kinase-like protein|nr:dihydroxyacetone kinase subunit DhaL [Synergistota bacterium]OPZ40798.1 MAG: PTS-dependent dihydroxyacetone kinase, ADP-binding subunit DhaL [Synergistetes bacterium ADurb.BinA166]
MKLDIQGVIKALDAVGRSLAENKDYLTELDSAIGDADHGINMNRGFQKVHDRLTAGSYADLGAVLKDVGMTLMGSVGGASGPLYGTMFMKMSSRLAGREELDTPSLAEAVEEGLKGIVALGRANLQDKTMVDSLTPAVEALKRAASEGLPLEAALESAVEAARTGMESTIPLVARKGRASYLGERSAGHQDPGATSVFLILSAILETAREETA